MTEPVSDADAVSYELDRLQAFLKDYEEAPDLRERVIKLVDYAAWEQLTTSIRGLRHTIRNVEGQVRGRK